MVELLQGKKGTDILVMDLRRLTDTTDYFVLCTGTSDQHVRALADEIVDKTTAAGDPPWHVEGYEARRWVLLDFVDVVVHLFRPEVREFYALERLWRGAACVRFDDGTIADRQEPSAAPVDAVFSRS